MAKCKPWLLCCIVLVGLGCLVALVCLSVASLAAGECPRGAFRRAAVAADSRVCSEAGRSMLQQGGSAVDGAIAALLCTSVVNPQSMGIGGGSIVTLRNRTGHIKVYNFRETVPRSFKADLLSDCPTTFRMSTGGTWIGVPGELRGYQSLHREYGKLPWAKLFEPTIKLARDGISMPPFLTKLLNESFVKDLVEKSSLCQVFCNKNKTVLKEGDILKFSKLAETMQVIAEKGAEVFYSGSVAQDLIKDIQEAGGTLDMEDLKNFKVRVTDAWKVPLGEADLHVAPPPAGGALLAFILRLMKEFSLTPDDLGGERGVKTYHHYIEVAKFANGQKRSIRDPQFNNPKGSDHLIDPSFIRRIRAMISPNRTHDAAYYTNVKPSSASFSSSSSVPSDRFGTTHLSVLDDDGLGVSATSTINQLFGGAVYSPRTGVILNNELSDFCGRADALRAGEQPPSSMTPAILELKSGGLLLIGGSGGSMITSAVALSIMNRLWLGMNLKEAIAAPIIFVDSKNIANFERGFNESVEKELRALRHSVGKWPRFFNVVNGLEKEPDGCIAAVSDSRKGGEPAGY